MSERETDAEIARFPFRATEYGRHAAIKKKLERVVSRAIHEAFQKAVEEGLPQNEAASIVAIAAGDYLEDK